MSARLFFYTLFLCSQVCFPQAGDFDVAREAYTERLEEIDQTFLKEKVKLYFYYNTGLDKLEASSMASGHLDGVLAVQLERERYLLDERVDVEDIIQNFPALAKGQKHVLSELGKLDTSTAVLKKELSAKYLTFLKSKEVELVRAKKITDAQAVRREIARVQGGIPKFRMEAPKTAPLKTTPPVEPPQNAIASSRKPQLKPAPLLAPSDGTPQLLSGSAPGQGGDFSGQFLYAIDFAGKGGKVGSANFLEADKTKGLAVLKMRTSDARPHVFEENTPEDQLLSKIVWKRSWVESGPLIVDLDVVKGSAYRLQLMWTANDEKKGYRLCKVAVDGGVLIARLDLGETSHIKSVPEGKLTNGVISTVNLVAATNRLRIELLPISRHPTLSALTLEAEGKSGMGALKRPAGGLIQN